MHHPCTGLQDLAKFCKISMEKKKSYPRSDLVREHTPRTSSRLRKGQPPTDQAPDLLLLSYPWRAQSRRRASRRAARPPASSSPPRRLASRRRPRAASRSLTVTALVRAGGGLGERGRVSGGNRRTNGRAKFLLTPPPLSCEEGGGGRSRPLSPGCAWVG